MRDPQSWRLETAGRKAFPGFQLLTLDRTSSTQDIVRTAARGGAAAGYCCVASEQSAGRGRHQRRWSAPAGSALLCSTLVRVSPGVVGGVSLAAGLAVRIAVTGWTGVDIRVKWPNDVLFDGRKLAGILCEVEPRASTGLVPVIIGVGVNLRVDAAPPGTHATSIEAIAGATPAPGALLERLLPELSERLTRLAAGGVAAMRDEWLAHATGLGGAVVAEGPDGVTRGIAEDIDNDGALLIRTHEGLRRVLAADVHLVAPRP